MTDPLQALIDQLCTLEAQWRERSKEWRDDEDELMYTNGPDLLESCADELAAALAGSAGIPSSLNLKTEEEDLTRRDSLPSIEAPQPASGDDVIRTVPPFQHPGYVIRRAKPRPIPDDDYPESSPSPQTWQPMETAPVGTRVLMFVPETPGMSHGVFAGVKVGFTGRCVAAYGGAQFLPQPTLWMPLPSPSTKGSE